MKKKMIIQECESDGCSGWKGPDECPNNGKFNAEYPACQECEKDAMEALTEAYKEKK